MAQRTDAARFRPRGANLLQQTHCIQSKKTATPPKFRTRRRRFATSSWQRTTDKTARQNAAGTFRQKRPEIAKKRRNDATRPSLRKRRLCRTGVGLRGFRLPQRRCAVRRRREGRGAFVPGRVPAGRHGSALRKILGVFTGHRRTSKGTVLRMLSSSASSSSR